MTNYLLDTNICIFLLRGKYDVDKKIDSVGLENCAISEITVAELNNTDDFKRINNIKIENWIVR